MNRQTKRLLQRQGQLAPDGTFIPKVATQPERVVRSREPVAEKPPLYLRVVNYFKEVMAELRRVAWGTRSEVINFSILVTVCVVFIGLVVFGIDFGVNKFVQFLFSK